jgi:hypothetical protein
LAVCRTHYRPRKPEHERARVRRIVYSSSSSASESERVPSKPGTSARHGNDDVIEITDSSDDDDDQRCPKPLSARAGAAALERQHDEHDDDGLLVL